MLKLIPVVEGDEVVGLRGTCLDLTSWRQAEVDARLKEQEYLDVVELSPNKPWTADSNGNVITMGAAWTRMTGRPIEEALGVGWMQVVHPDDLPAAHAMIRQAQAGQP